MWNTVVVVGNTGDRAVRGPYPDTHVRCGLSAREHTHHTAFGTGPLHFNEVPALALSPKVGPLCESLNYTGV